MAVVNFYLIAGGSGAADINAGSSTGAAQATTTNGNWNSATGVFIAGSGTPFASTIVGDYASVYVDGATVTTFVGKVTAVTSSTQITVDVASIFYGTAPTTLATTRSCTINGAWATEQVLAAGGLAGATMPQSTKINIKGNLTVGGNRTISMAGTAVNALWFAGYSTTPGDLDGDTVGGAKPTWTFSAGNFTLTLSGARQRWSAVSVKGANTLVNVVQVNSADASFVRCRFEATAANAGSFALSANGSCLTFAYCYFKAPATATSNGTVVNGGNSPTFIGCVFDTGGKAGCDIGAIAAATFYQCVFLSCVAGVLASSGTARIVDCTFYSLTDGFKFTTATSASVVAGCLFSTCTNGINNASGTNTNVVNRYCNDYYNCTNNEVGLGDTPAFFGQTDAADPLTNAAGGDVTPVLTSNAPNNGFPGTFENETYSSFRDIGAIQIRASMKSPSRVAIFGG